MNLSNYKNQEDVLVLRMQFFCLDPKRPNFDEICASKKIQNSQSEYLHIWKLACLTQYGQRWGLSESEWNEHKGEFSKELRKIYSRLLMKPTSSILDRMWYVFFATGDINALEAVFGVSGNTSANKNLQVSASTQFETFRDEYKRKIQEALDKDSNYFRNHETVYGMSDADNYMLSVQTVFTRFQDKIDKASSQLEDDGDGTEIKGILERLHGSDSTDTQEDIDTFVSNVSPEVTTKPSEHLEDLCKKFDAIAKDVLGDGYVTKGK
jgi:hypothetical protein